MSTHTALPWTEADEAVVYSTARRLRSKYREFCEFEDIRQELYLWLSRNHAKVSEWRREHHPKSADRLLGMALRNEGERYCRREKAERSGYAIEDEFFYSIQMVAETLQLYFDPTWMEPSQQPDDSGSSNRKPPNEGFNLPAMVADVGRAYEDMPRSDQQLLERVYGGHMPVREAIELEATEWEVTDTAADKRIRRVLGRLRTKLGGPNPWGNR